MRLLICSESSMMHAAVGINWMAETVDPFTSLFAYSPAPFQQTLAVSGSGSLTDLQSLIAARYGIPVERQEMWLLRARSSSYGASVRAYLRLEPNLRHAPLSLGALSTLLGEEAAYRLQSGAATLTIFLRDTAIEPRVPARPLPKAKEPLLVQFKFWDVPTQSMIFFGSAYFEATEHVQVIREYCAELIRKRCSESTPMGEILRASLTHLLDEDDEPIAASALSSSHVCSIFEVNGSDARSFAFNFAVPSRDAEVQRRFKALPDWNAITTDMCNVKDGEMCMFHLRYKPEQLQWLRQRYEQQRQEWDDELRIKRTHLKPAADASSQAASSQVVIPSLPLRSFKCQFSDTCVQALKYIAYRVVIEFRTVPVASSVFAPFAAAPAAVAAAPLLLELLKTDSISQLVASLGQLLDVPAARIRLFVPSAHDLSSVQVNQRQLGNQLSTLLRSADFVALLYYSVDPQPA